MRRQTPSLLSIFSLIFLSSTVVSSAQSINIFGNLVPVDPTQADNAPITLGVKFWSSEPGAISGIRFYRPTASPSGYVAQLYSAAGALLGSVTIAHESAPLPGWQVANFAAPISISPNTTYVAAYYLPSSTYQRDYNAPTLGVTTGPLTAPAGSAVGGNGVFNFGSAFPSSIWGSTNFYVDVAFSPAVSTPYLTLSFNPPNPSITSSAPLDSVVATITASWSDGSPFAGTLSFGPPYSNDQGVFAISGDSLIVNPSGPGVSSDANATLNVTVVATQ